MAAQQPHRDCSRQEIATKKCGHLVDCSSRLILNCSGCSRFKYAPALKTSLCSRSDLRLLSPLKTVRWSFDGPTFSQGIPECHLLLISVRKFYTFASAGEFSLRDDENFSTRMPSWMILSKLKNLRCLDSKLRIQPENVTEEEFSMRLEDIG